MLNTENTASGRSKGGNRRFPIQPTSLNSRSCWCCARHRNRLHKGNKSYGDSRLLIRQAEDLFLLGIAVWCPISGFWPVDNFIFQNIKLLTNYMKMSAEDIK